MFSLIAKTFSRMISLAVRSLNRVRSLGHGRAGRPKRGHMAHIVMPTTASRQGGAFEDLLLSHFLRLFDRLPETEAAI
jgi:hypothetical protein